MNKNTIELIGYYGGDITHALSAWTSTNRSLSSEKQERLPKLLKQLAENGHHTPFEKSSLHFLVTCEIASHLHIAKHRIGVSMNAESARYKELKEDKYYIPDDWPIELQEMLKQHTEQGLKLYHDSLAALVASGMPRKRAKESARYFRGYNTQIDCDIMFNWRSFAYLQSLRNHPDAQKEIRDIAAKMLQLVKEIEGNPFRHTIAAFGL